ncbi:protein of unknown function [Aminobacter niigataensis]|nr:protein of unknown function [Aminobacter niigataensis]
MAGADAGRTSRIPQRPLCRRDGKRRRRRPGIHACLCRARGDAGRLCPPGGQCRGHVSPAIFGAHGHRHDGGEGGVIRLRSAMLSALIPPPLTPPHKGEGNDFTGAAKRFAGGWGARALPQDSPPPCGEGLGVGVILDTTPLSLAQGG